MQSKLRRPQEILRDRVALQTGSVMRFGAEGSWTARLDLGVPGKHWKERHALGKARRDAVPRERQGESHLPKDRPDPVETLEATNRERLKELIPIRMGRLAASPMAYLRGADAVMAWDLGHTPTSGIDVVIDGDAHLNNFGLYGTPQQEVVFDLNDFDEATIGPWEWDLKRLAASFNVAGRENGLTRPERLEAVRRCVEAYRTEARQLESMGYLDMWYLISYPGDRNPVRSADPTSVAITEKAVAKAYQQTNARLLQKIGERDVTGAWRLRQDPPILTRVDTATRSSIVAGLNDYVNTLAPDWRFLVSHYHVVDVAQRVVGVGSVGTRAYLALLFGNDDNDPLFLQIKEATHPVAAPYTPPLPEEMHHDGWRVVAGQLILQATSDILLGWTTIEGRPYYVRQMKNLKGSIPVEFLSGEPFNFYAWACGRILARAHCRLGAGAEIAGYCGRGNVLDLAIAKWAERYGDQNERDHAALLQAIAEGQVEAVANV